MLYSVMAQQGQTSSGSAAGGLIGSVIGLAIAIVAIVAMWRLFTKAGQPGWASIIPIYNVVVLLKIVGRPVWWLLLFLIPIVNFVVIIMVYIDLAKSFGKGVGFGIGLLLLAPIFFAILAFGSAQYRGPAAGAMTAPTLTAV